MDSAVRGVIDTPEADPFLKYQEIRHQDFGEIVFKKNKRSKKKNVKGQFLKEGRDVLLLETFRSENQDEDQYEFLSRARKLVLVLVLVLGSKGLY